MTPFQHYARTILLLLLTSSAYHPVGLIHNHLWNPSIMTLVSDCHVLPDGSISSRNKSTELFNCPCPCILVLVYTDPAEMEKNHHFNTIFYSPQWNLKDHLAVISSQWKLSQNGKCKKQVCICQLLIFFSFLKNIFKNDYRSISALSITSAYSFKNIFFAII